MLGAIDERKGGMTRLITSGRSIRSVSARLVAQAVLSLSACTTGPRDDFNGTWSSELPKGVGISFSVYQHGSMASGLASNCGPATGSVTGSVIGEHVSLAFPFPHRSACRPCRRTPWFRGSFKGRSPARLRSRAPRRTPTAPRGPW